ncbi:hypothetical protein AB833_15460 [Chromatiales bacterium (ex Bugula neritina AB1)]|nr:hypothetical protein AB833_15460 [Chromatiales bacterium (ex Bugula neritina AB1)]
MNSSGHKQRDFTSLWNRPGFLIRRLHQIHVAIFLDECNEFNVTPVQFGVLTVLNTQESLDQVTIASSIGVDRNTTADVIRRLEARGLIERPASVTDKRAKLARITEAGRQFVASVQPAMIDAQRRLTKTLSREENEQLMRLMRKLINDNNDASRAPMRQDD